MMMEDITRVLEDYDKYLDNEGYAIGTRRTYVSTLRRYMQKHNLQDKQQLTSHIAKQTSKGNMGSVFNWLRQKPSKKKKTPQQYHPRDDPLFQRLIKERRLKKTTSQGYMSSLILYINMCGFQNLEEMINEAWEDEKKHIPPKETRLQKHLDDYKIYLQETDHIKSSHSFHTYYTKIETIYRHYNITIPARPPIKIKKEYHVGYFELPDKDMIEKACMQSDLRMTSLIYFMISSGTAKAETLSITVGTFIDSLREYTNESDPRKAVQELRGRRDIVPLISLTRIKTNVPYYTCCSTEAAYYILEYMGRYERYTRDTPLWDMKGSYLMKRFQRLNDDNNWGMVGNYRRFRSHMLRKFHASNLGASFDLINTLEGRTNGVIHETYVKIKPSVIKEKYLEYMVNVMIHPELFWYPGKSETEVKEYDKQYTIPDGNRHDTIHADSTGDGHGDMQTTTGALMKELLERIAVLEYRVKQLEQKGV
jgi:hypothetical protein